MNAIQFWSANRAVPFNQCVTFSARYEGTGSDYEMFKEQINASLVAHANRRNMTVVAITTTKEEGHFSVYAVAVPNG